MPIVVVCDYLHVMTGRSSVDEPLRYLQAIVEHGNLTRAAESLFITQPALSRYLGRIERSVGALLIDRSTQPLQLTVEGERYHEYLVAAQRLRASLDHDLADMSRRSGTSVRLGTTSWRSESLLPRVIPAILEEHPDLQVSFFGLSNADLMSRVRSKSIDLAVMSSVHAGIGVQFQKVTEEEFVVAGAELRHVAPALRDVPNGGSITAAQLKPVLQSQRLILMNADHNIGAVIRDFITRLGVTLRHVISSNSISACVELASRSVGVTFVPTLAVLRPGIPDLPYFRVRGADLTQDVGLAWPADAEPKGAVAVLADALSAQIRADHEAAQPV
jgi:DNA-binding transcriptional LysR family regulator